MHVRLQVPYMFYVFIVFVVGCACVYGTLETFLMCTTTSTLSNLVAVLVIYLR